VWAVTAVTLRALVDFTLYRWSERVLRPVLLLTREDALVEELCVLASIESVVSHVLAVVCSGSATLAPGLALLAARLVAHAVVVRDVVHGLELLHLVDSVIVQVVLVIAHGVALIKVRLGDTLPVLVVIRSASIYIADRDAVGARVFGVEGCAGSRQGKRQCLVEVARRRNLTSIFVLLAILRSILYTGDSTFG